MMRRQRPPERPAPPARSAIAPPPSSTAAYADGGGGGEEDGDGDGDGDDDVDDDDDGLDPWMGPPRDHRSSSAPPPPSRSDKRRALAILALVACGLAALLVLGGATSASERDIDALDTLPIRHHGGAGATGGGGGGDRGGKKGGYIGFHDASIENIYGANRYRKPPGAGYHVRPRGGLHPVFVYDGDRDDDDNGPYDAFDYDEDDDDDDDDYEASPYADARLDMTTEEREAERKVWAEKLREMRESYGYWDLADEYGVGGGDPRPFVDWRTIAPKSNDYDPLVKEIDPVDFPKRAWQGDDVYVSRLIDEGRKLVRRVRDAVYDEVGWEPGDGRGGGVELLPDDNDGKDDSPPPSSSAKGGGTRDGTVGWMYERSFRALSKKLLKAMITNDHFFVTLGGHSAAAGHGEFVVGAATTTTDHIDKREEEGGGDGGDRRVFLPFAPAFFLHFRRHRRRRRSQNSPSFSLVKGNNFGQSYMMGK